jgi:acyl-CoA thioesterase-1
MLTGPAAEGTVRTRFRTWTNGFSDKSGAAGSDAMESMTARYGLHAAVRKAARAVVCLLFTWLLMCPAYAAPIRLLILGDSLTAGYGLAKSEGFQAQLAAALKARGHDVVLIDGAVSGDTTAGGRARLEWALGDGAEAAIVELGANDGLRGLDPKGSEANLAAILDTLAGKKIRVLLSGMLAPPNLGPEYAQAFQGMYARLGARPGILFDPFFLEGVAGDPSLNQADRIHPTPEGVKREVARLLPLVEKLLASVTAQ